jgi:hypothetical protein
MKKMSSEQVSVVMSTKELKLMIPESATPSKSSILKILEDRN